MKIVLQSVFYLVTFILVACASQPPLSEQEALQTYPAVGELDSAMRQVDKESLALLSQKSFREATSLYNKARALATQRDAKANAVAIEGQLALNKAVNNAVKAKDIFSDALEARDRALSRGALAASTETMQEVEKDFKALALALETGREDEAKLGRRDIIQRYNNLELASLKKATVESAKNALSLAKDNKSNKYAPKTFAAAEHELSLATSILDSDIQSKDRAQQHAAKAEYLAEASISISDTVKEFRENEYSFEDIVLWYHQQLEKATSPLQQDIALNVPNQHLVKSISDSINDVVNEREALKLALNESDQRYTDAVTAGKTELAALERQRMQKEEDQKKLERVQSLFNPDEASVYLQHGNILIRAQGFWFPSGKSEIESRNFSLLNKISQAISNFPNAKIVVSGHTDSIGDEKLNLTLSKERAEKVSSFLQEIGNVSPERLSSTGYGKTMPVANNETEEGRAANRRVEVLIVN